MRGYLHDAHFRKQRRSSNTDTRKHVHEARSGEKKYDDNSQTFTWKLYVLNMYIVKRTILKDMYGINPHELQIIPGIYDAFDEQGHRLPPMRSGITWCKQL